MITEQQLIRRGYRKHKGGGIAFQFSDFFYQLKFTDEDGIRYWLEFVHYEELPGGDKGGSWMCNLNINDPHCTFQQHRVKDLDLSEKLAVSVWIAIGAPYYEKYQEMKA